MHSYAAYVRRNRHFIVIENDYHRFAADCRIIQCLIGHATGHRTIANHRDNMVSFALKRSGSRHAQRNGNRAGCMSCHKGVCRAFCGLGEAGNSAKLTQAGKFIPTAGKDLMNIGLMTDIQNQPIFHGIVYSFDSHRQLYHTQVGCQMSSCFRNVINEKFPDFLAQLDTLLLG